jgi:peptidoglycan/xylan/chitin deacetylase (PgdA/CDA1 family)
MINICFHGIGEPNRELEPGESQYWITTDSFNRILDEVVGWPSAAISFDDGNSSDYRYGLPALVDRGVTAVFFVLSGRFGQAGSLSPDNVRELHRCGMLIGSHGMHHLPWRGLPPAARDRELIEAREVISAVIDSPVDQAALPLGRYDRRLLAELRELGYVAVHTSDRHAARPGAWLQPRFSVRRDDTAQSLRRNVVERARIGARVEGWVKGVVKRLR